MGSRLEKTSSSVRKRIERHTFEDEEGDEYESSKFGGFPEYFRRKKIKLQNRDAARRVASDKPAIFKGTVVHVNGYTQPSLNDIHNLVIDHGGGFLQYLDGKTMVTHIVASSLTPKKKVEFRKYRIVKPAWIVDSVAAGKLLPWENYRVVDEGARQNLLGFQEGQMVSQTNKSQTGYREQTDTSWYTGQMKNVADGLQTKSEDSTSAAVPSSSALGDGAHDQKEKESSRTEKKAEQNQVSFNYGSFNSGDLPAAVDEEITKVYPDLQTGSSDAAKLENVHTEPLDTLSKDEKLAAGLPANLTLKDDLQNFTGRKLTAEEHNAILLSDPRIWRSSTVNPGFLKQYYEESRLHHLSAWKAELKSKLQAHARELSASQQARQKRISGSRRYIFHVDFDSFFVAVSLLKHPEWVDKPVVVAHGDGSGSEIASCNYPARTYGVKNGMWMKNATELCPDLKTLPYDFKAYEDASREFYAAIMETGGVVQSVSVDEALIDLSNACAQTHSNQVEENETILREQAKANEIAGDLRTKIRSRTGCEVSVGIGGNILQAKVALRKAKPAGQYLMTPDIVLETIGNLEVQDLPGVAHSMGAKLEEIGIKLVKDIREASKERLVNALGPKTGDKLWEYARGIDKVEVGDQVIRKSVSAEVNWGVRFVTQEQADEFIRCLCDELEKRLQNENVKGRQFTMKIMRKSADSPLDPPKHLGHGKCDTFNKSVVLGVSTTDCKVLAREALSILRGFGFSPGELRGIGLQMTKLEPLKPIITDNIKGQRALQFKSAPKREPARNADPDEVETPEKPVKFIKHPAASLAIPKDENKTTSLLNTSGTQFLLPSQTDPKILAELPEEMRSKLVGKSGLLKENATQPKLKFKSRSGSPAPPAPPLMENLVPSASQIDLEVLAALPEDLRAEVLGFHNRSPYKAIKQSMLPQSPHKDRTIKLGNKTTPTKSKTSSLARVRGHLKDSKTSLMQANFAKLHDTRQAKSSEPVTASEAQGEEISAEFLAALPDDIRQEILDQQRRDRLKRKGGLEMGANKKRPKHQAAQQQRVIELEPRPPKPEFTSMKLSTLPQLREAITEWYHAFGDEEPNDKDVDTLCTYLRRVVLEERDMSKAVGIIRWLLWTVDQDDRPFNTWRKAVEMLKDVVQSSIKERGIGPVSFD